MVALVPVLVGLERNQRLAATKDPGQAQWPAPTPGGYPVLINMCVMMSSQSREKGSDQERTFDYLTMRIVQKSEERPRWVR